MALRPCCNNGFTVLTNGQMQKTIAGKLIPCVDHLRDLNTQFGVRPYIVRRVWTQWSEGRRDYGVENVQREELMLPTPSVDPLTALDVQTLPVGNEEFGQLMVSEISGRFTEDQLVGRGPQGEPIPRDTNYYYEIEYPNADGSFPGVRRRFTVAGVPWYDAAAFQWKLTLMRAGENRLRDGTPED